MKILKMELNIELTPTNYTHYLTIFASASEAKH